MKNVDFGGVFDKLFMEAPEPPNIHVNAPVAEMSGGIYDDVVRGRWSDQELSKPGRHRLKRGGGVVLRRCIDISDVWD